MIEYQRYELDNGMKLLVHHDASTPLVAVNTLYQVGSKHEMPHRTGFAHLFEHLMFSGTEQAPQFDHILQMAGGDSNAYTNNDFTNFYEHLPAENVETAIWLEADRMQHLNITQRQLDVQRKVVLEEFSETCLNRPYGDVWHHLSALAYRTHSYRWPVIGMIPEHIAGASLEEVQAFYSKHYHPAHAVMAVAGMVEPDAIFEQVQKWFGDIQKPAHQRPDLPVEAPQTEHRFAEVQGDVALNAIYLVFHTPGRLHPDYYVTDLITDALANGTSSRLYRRLQKKRKLFTSIDAYVSGTLDTGLIVIEGKLSEHTDFETARHAIWNELHELTSLGLVEDELQKLKNQIEVSLVFADIHILNKAITLSFLESLGQSHIINKEAALYRAVTLEDIKRVCQQVFVPNNCSELWYRATDS